MDGTAHEKREQESDVDRPAPSGEDTPRVGKASLAARIAELQQQIVEARQETPEQTIQRLEEEVERATISQRLSRDGKPGIAKAVLDPGQRPEEMEGVKSSDVWKSEDVATAWADSGKVTDAQAAKILEAVRARAESWRTGTASVLAAITATLVFGGDTFTSIRGSAPVMPLVPYAVALSVVLALMSLYLTLRAANGPAFLDTKIRETVVEKASDRDMRRAGSAAADLKTAQALLATAVLCFLAALVTMWAAPPGT